MQYQDQILCGDHIAYLKQFPDECIDVIITSPPYDEMREYEGYTFNFEALAMECTRVLKQGGVLVWVVGDQIVDGSDTCTAYRQFLYFHDVCKLNLHAPMIFEKSNFAYPSNVRYHRTFEYMHVFSKGMPKTIHLLKDRPNNTKNTFPKQRRQKDGSTSNPDDHTRMKLEPFGIRFDVWRYKTANICIATDEFARLHPAIFPEELAQDHILSWSNEGDIVLDPCNGSGTTTKMAKKHHRHWIGIDCSQEYCDLAEQRLATIIDTPQKKSLDQLFPTLLPSNRLK